MTLTSLDISVLEDLDFDVVCQYSWVKCTNSAYYRVTGVYLCNGARLDKLFCKPCVDYIKARCGSWSCYCGESHYGTIFDLIDPLIFTVI